MPLIARSPPATRSRSRRPVEAGRSELPAITPPPPAHTPAEGLGPAPPATPIREPQTFVQPPKKGKTRAPVVEELLSESPNYSSDEDSAHENTTVTMERGRLRQRPSAIQGDPALLQLLKVLTESVASSKTTSSSNASGSFKTPALKAPDSFDGNPAKLRNFIQSCQLIFYNDEKIFYKDKKKVVYAASFLSGKAGKWIEPYLAHIDNEDPSFLLNSWKDFESQLFILFGDPNEVRKAEKDLDNLQMKEGALASSYITDFRTLTTKISDWGERALMYHFRKGLPARLLDQLAVHQTPLDTLQDLMSATLDYDIRYHERIKEKKVTSQASSSVSHVKEKSKLISTSQHKSEYPKTLKKKPKAGSNYSKPSRKELPSHLNEDYTLKPDEKERRVKAALCIYCGEKHKLEDCQKLQEKNKAKGKASVKA